MAILARSMLGKHMRYRELIEPNGLSNYTRRPKRQRKAAKPKAGSANAKAAKPKAKAASAPKAAKPKRKVTTTMAKSAS